MSEPNDIQNHSIDISVVICTYNRADMLADTLESFLKLKKPAEYKYELLIVDNNSNDRTNEIVAQYENSHTNIRYVFEPLAGLSFARNRGISEARGNIVAFVDDDVFFDCNWLIELSNILSDHPEAACFGGKSIPKFEAEIPDWYENEFLQVYGSTNSGEVIKWMEFPEHPFGLNMAFRRDIFEQIGAFNTQLGRKKKNLLSSEELDIFWRVNNCGLKVIYSPHALLYHRIPAERISKEWIISRYYWQGISDIVFHQTVAPRSRLALIKEALQLAFKLSRHIRGNHLSPRKVYWHYQSAKLPAKAHQARFLGQIKQLLLEIARV